MKDSQGRSVRDENGQPKLEPESMVSMRSVLDALSTCGAGNRLLLADCCREGPSQARGRAFGSKLRVADLPPGTAALFACSASERAFEHKDWGHGDFTQSLLERCESGDSELTANGLSADVYRDVRNKVREKTNGREQQTVNPIINSIVELKLSGAAGSIANSLGMKFVLVPAREFMMGLTKPASELAKLFDTEDEYFEGEYPSHRVRLSQSFYLQTTEVTQEQWKAVMGTEPWKDKDYVKKGRDYPATYVSWEDATEFCRKLGARAGGTYRLPTEAEWNVRHSVRTRDCTALATK
ncbi:MAG: sulfatase activating formylglycine-generating enzyme [Pirellulaceae bacterium]